MQKTPFQVGKSFHHPLGSKRNNSGRNQVNLLKELEESLPQQIYHILGRISDLADHVGIQAFLVQRGFERNATDSRGFVGLKGKARTLGKRDAC